METITKYKTSDGAEFSDLDKATAREELIAKVDAVMAPLGTVPAAVSHGKGWVHHDLETVLKVKDDILDLCRAEGYNKTFVGFKDRGRDYHPFSIVGRVLDDMGGPLCTAWRRIQVIDSQGREHQQPYYAREEGRPDPGQVCIEDRRKS
jgi:hypothetical protein